jgi:Carboxypeptidase regulatory-like domain/TonB dependent receptor
VENPLHVRFRGYWVALFAAALLIAGWSVPNVAAQTESGAVSGHVTDQSNAVVPDAQIEVRNTETGAVTSSRTNVDGIYVIPSLKPGNYLMTVNKVGFRSVSVTGMTLNVQDNLVRNFVLQVGSSAESVTVTADNENLQTGNSQLGTVVSERAVADLPLNGRNFTQLLTLTPGATPVSTSQGANLGSDDGSTVAIPGSSFANPSIHGQWNRSAVYLLDGVINTDFRTTTYTILPIVDTIQEFKVQSHNDSAEFGTVLGGMVNLVSKSGTNSLHGSVWEFLRNDYFDARNKFTDIDSNGNPKAPGAFRQNEFGGAVGGPVYIPKLYNGKNKTFFYFGYEGWRYRRAANAQPYRVPTAQELSGDFSSSNLLPEQTIYDPATTTVVGGVLHRDPFPGNIIPTDRIDPMVQQYLQTYFDHPNLVGNPVFNAINPTSAKNDSNSYTVKIDQRISDHDNAWFRYSRMNVTQANPQTLQVTQFQTMSAKNIGAGWVHSFSPSVLLDVQGGYAARPFTFTSPPNAGIGPMQQQGWGGLDTYGPVAVNLSGFWGGSGISSPALRGNPNYSVSGNLSWIRSAHTFRAGFQWIDQRRTQSGNAQHWDFNSAQTADPNNATSTGASLASALLGLPANGGFALNNIIDYSIASWGGYFQDTWKVRPRVTLNLGLRYDHINQPSLSQGLQTSFDNNTGTYLIGGSSLPPDCATAGAAPCIPANVPFSEHIALDPNPIHGPNPVWDNVGPRVGFAWAATDKIAVRAGYGLIFDTLTGLSQSFSNSMNSWPASGQTAPSFNAAGDPLVTVGTAQTQIQSPLPGPSPWGNGTWYEDANHKNAYSHQWNVEIQRQMTTNLIMSVGYVGSKTNRNDLTGYANTALPGLPGTNAEIQARTPFPWYNGQYFYQTSNGKGNYNAFEFKAQRRFAAGFQYLVSYTWSKAIDNGSSGWFDAEGGAGGSGLQDFRNPDGSRSVSGYDVPHFLSISGTWEPPVGKGKRFLSSGPASWILGNWQINTVTQLRSGQPFNLSVSGDPANVGAGIPWFAYARPNLVGNPHVSDPSAGEWFNTAAFAAPVNSFGNFGRNVLRSANVYDVDLSIFKSFPVGETNAFELRGEAFNVFNITNLGVPDVTLQSSTFGQIHSLATHPRELQLALKFIF